MSKIKSITETTFPRGNYSGYDGFVVALDDGNDINLGISNGQSCCENWGYFLTNDQPQDFIGAEVLEVKVVDACLNVEKVPKLYEGGAMFVNVETDRGTLQFTAYNAHNGYYSHEAVFVHNGVTNSEYL